MVCDITKIGLKALFRCHGETLCSQLSVNNSLCVKQNPKDFWPFRCLVPTILKESSSLYPNHLTIPIVSNSDDAHSET
jgi:hypothetical protein